MSSSEYIKRIVINARCGDTWAGAGWSGEGIINIGDLSPGCMVGGGNKVTVSGIMTTENA